jgi:putative transposase
MGHVFRQLYYHVVWSTKGREPSLTGPLPAQVEAAVEEKCRSVGCVVHAVKAVEDHVHVALEIPPTQAVSSVVGQAKGFATHQLNARQPVAVYWQEGFGVVTFRKGELPKVVDYVRSQEERHRNREVSPVMERCEHPE